jgi:hypothetical protein
MNGFRRTQSVSDLSPGDSRVSERRQGHGPAAGVAHTLRSTPKSLRRLGRTPNNHASKDHTAVTARGDN